MTDTRDTPKVALAEALAPWLAEYKAGIIGTFSVGSPRWDERTSEDRESWMIGATDEAEHASPAILVAMPDWTLVPSGTRWHHSPDAPPEHFCADCDEQRAEIARLRHAIVQADIWMAQGFFVKAHDHLEAALSARLREVGR